MKKIVLTGPESTGKTTLAKELAHYYQTGLVAEYARHYINKIDRAYTQEDLLEIALGQLRWEKKEATIFEDKGFIICDTDLLVLKVWSEYKYGDCNNFILEKLENNLGELYILCNIDIPWEADEQRENPFEREDLFEIYKQELTEMGVDYILVEGDRESRFLSAVLAIDKALNK